MKIALHILILPLLGSNILFGQEVSHADSIEITNACKSLFDTFENKDTVALYGCSTDKIYCISCYEEHEYTDTSYFFDKEEFIENHFWSIGTIDLIERSKKYNQFMLVKEPNEQLEITIFWTTYKPNELGQGREGAQLGIHFKKVDGEFKFAGMETVP